MMQWIQILMAQLPDPKQFLEQLKERAKLEQIDREKLKIWIADGKEFVLSHEQVKRLLGDERVQTLAKALKTTQEQFLEQAGQYLPIVLARLEQIQTHLPTTGVFTSAFNLAKGFFENQKTASTSATTAASTPTPTETVTETDPVVVDEPSPSTTTERTRNNKKKKPTAEL